MGKSTIKSAIITSVSLAILACTNTLPNNPPNNNLENFQDLDKEYQFSTQYLGKS
jgi:hypothetical protein